MDKHFSSHVLLATLLLIGCTTTLAFGIPEQRLVTTSKISEVSFANNVHNDERYDIENSRKCMGRREAMNSFFASLAISTAAVNQGLSWSSPEVAHAGLLDEFGSDPTKIETKVVLASATSSTSSAPRAEIDPSLRASYYYPTAKKRYLPRIQKVTAEIEACSNALAEGDWDSVKSFAKTAENAVLPLQLYVSSLDGQGLSMSTEFAKQMRRNASEYEKAYQRFDKALQKKDSSTALEAVSEMGVAVASYRLAGRLKDDDGNIPSIDEMKRMTMRRPTIAIASSK